MEWYELLVWGILVFLVIVITLISYYVAISMIHPHRKSLLESRQIEMSKTPDLMEAYDTWQKITYTIETRNRYDLKAYYLPTEQKNDGIKRFCIIAHGYSYTHHGGIKYAAILKKLGYSIILYDERYHGESGGPNCSLGYHEKDDLDDVINDTYTRFGSDITLGLYGESMGGATVLMTQATHPKLQFVISDCAFSDLSLLVRYLIKRKTHLPSWLIMPLANIFFYLATKATFRSISPMESVRNTSVPILLIHGTADEFIPPIHAKRLFEACGGSKQLYLSTHPAKHAETYLMNREEYEAIVRDFIASTTKSDFNQPTTEEEVK